MVSTRLFVFVVGAFPSKSVPSTLLAMIVFSSTRVPLSELKIPVPKPEFIALCIFPEIVQFDTVRVPKFAIASPPVLPKIVVLLMMVSPALDMADPDPPSIVLPEKVELESLRVLNSGRLPLMLELT